MVPSLYGNATMTIDCGNVCIVSERLTTRVKIDVNEINRPFPSSKKSHFQSEAKCEAIDMKMIFNYDANQTHFHNKGFWKWDFWNSEMAYCWFSHDVTKIQTKKTIDPTEILLSRCLRAAETNFRFKRVLGFEIEYAWIYKLLRDAAFTCRPRELSCRLKTGADLGGGCRGCAHPPPPSPPTWPAVF